MSEFYRIDPTRVFIDGVVYSKGDSTLAKPSSAEWLYENRKLLMGSLGAVAALVEPAIEMIKAKNWGGLALIVSGFLGMGLAHASGPAKADVVAAITPTPTPVATAQPQSLLYGDMYKGPLPTKEGPA